MCSFLFEQDLPMLVGNLVSFLSGTLSAVVVSWLTNYNMTEEEADAEWEKTRDIDNPLSPWVAVYQVSKINHADQKLFKC